MKYKINEIFYSIQGEGVRVGTVNVFVRFASCNLACVFCDTDFSSFTEMTEDEIVEKCIELDIGGHKNIILTGGEPSMQYDLTLYKCLKGIGFYIAIETNGMHKLMAPVDFITCSPKTAEHTIRVHKTQAINELKYIRDINQAIPLPSATAEHYLISPLFRDGHELHPETVAWCIDLCKNNSPWRLSLQTHKLTKTR